MIVAVRIINSIISEYSILHENFASLIFLGTFRKHVKNSYPRRNVSQNPRFLRICLYLV